MPLLWENTVVLFGNWINSYFQLVPYINVYQGARL
jgi:hypothetical protein